MDQLLDEQVIVLEEQEQGLELDKEELEAVMAELKENLTTQFGSEKKINSTLRKFNLRWDDLEEISANNLKMQKLYEKVTAEVKITDEEVEAYYRDHPDEFEVPEQIKASHILVEDKKLAEELRARLEEGEDFAQLAQEHSTDPGSRESGGQLGYFSAGQMVPEFDQAAFATPVGEISPVTETNFGYHIIMVEDKQPARTLELEEVELFLAEQLLNLKRNEQFQSFFLAARKKHQAENKLATEEPDLTD